jgi:hypothetical protein
MTIEELVRLSKCSVSLVVNGHRDYYQTVEQYLADDMPGCSDVSPETRQRMIETDTTVHLQWYPNTPIGFNVVVAATLEDALRMAEDLINSGEQP